MTKTRNIVFIVAIAAMILLSGCSPEASRARSGGPGADIGNRGATVEMHGPTNPAYQEPAPGKALELQKPGTK